MPEGGDARPPAVVRAWRWIWEPSERSLHVDACPRCGSTVVVAQGRPEQAFDRDRLTAVFGRARRPGALGRKGAAGPPDEGQLLAACPEHGWSPYNERSLRLRSRRPD